jgi:hypothetical protein
MLGMESVAHSPHSAVYCNVGQCQAKGLLHHFSQRCCFLHMSAGNEKKSQNLSTCRATPSQELKLKKAIKLKGFRRPSDFWFRCMETFIEQVDAQQDLLWPLQFAQRIQNSAHPKKLPPKKKGA